MYITRFRTKKIAAYVGIPYAQPPIDSKRFQAPDYTTLPSWEGTRNATIYAPDCLQTEPTDSDEVQQVPLSKHDKLFMKLLETQLEEPKKKEFAEDCLYLNVYVPDGKLIRTLFNNYIELLFERYLKITTNLLC